jgi:hypothetical protein
MHDSDPAMDGKNGIAARERKPLKNLDISNG